MARDGCPHTLRGPAPTVALLQNGYRAVIIPVVQDLREHVGITAGRHRREEVAADAYAAVRDPWSQMGFGTGDLVAAPAQPLILDVILLDPHEAEGLHGSDRPQPGRSR